MKLAIFSDLHVHDWQEFSVDRSRLHHGISVLKQIRKYCLKHNVDAVLFGGDLFHKRGVLYTLPYNLMVEELAEWRRNKLPLYANVGNHDAADRLAKVHALTALASAGLLFTVGESGWANWTLDRGKVDITAIAYCSEANELRRRTDAALEDRAKLGNADAAIGLFHHGFKGARVGTSLEYMVKEDADADAYASEFMVMFSGHYHAHQEIGSQGNAWYVGSPMEFVRGETSPKGFLVLDTDEAEIERIDIDLPRFVKLTGANLGNEDFDVRDRVKGNYVDFVFDELPMPWEKVEATLLKLGALDVKAMPTRADKLPKSSRLQVDPTQGDRALLESYMEYAQVDPSERDDLLRIGMELLGEVSA
jgi:DNA repair exonuclease SbcCD nuclease subunit